MNNNLNEFADRVTADLTEKFPEHKFEVRKVERLQSSPYTGLTVTKRDGNAGAIVKLDDYYERLKEGESYADLLDDISGFIGRETERAEMFGLEDFASYESVKNKLELQLVPTDPNREVLSAAPHREILDMSLVCRIGFSDEATALVKWGLLDIWKVSEEQVFEDALGNSGVPKIRSMTEMMEELTGMKLEEKVNLWVAMNGAKRFGASVLAHPDFFETASGILGRDFFILPSSIHELLLVPDTGEMNADDLREMVTSINASEVDESDRLTDEVYHYDTGRHAFEFASDYARRKSAETGEILTYRDAFGNDIRITSIRVGTYGKNSLPVNMELYCEDGPYAAVTKNFGNASGNESIVMPFCGWIDTNNNPGIVQFLQENEIAKPYERFGEPVFVQSGFCTYPYYQFDRERLSRLDPKGTEGYLKNWEKAQKKALKSLCL